MVKIVALSLGLVVISLGCAGAQDIAGIEDCTKTAGLDKRTGCLQSNVNFLQQLVAKTAREAREKLSAAGAEIVALKGEVAALKTAVTTLQASVDQLQAPQKAVSDKKSDKK